MKLNSKYVCDSCKATTYELKPHMTKRLVRENAKFNVVECSGCGLHSLFPVPTNKDLEWIYSDYATKGDRIKVERERQKYVYPRKIELIRKYNPVAKNILDIGSGLGGFKAIAINHGYKVTGIELEEEQVKKAKEIFNVDLKLQIFDDFKNENTKKYDVVMLHHVLEHLQKPATVLRQIKNMLNKNGLLLIEVPNQFFNLKKRINIVLGRTPFKYPYNPYHHIYFYSPKTLKSIAIKSGYNIIELNEVGARSSNKNSLSKQISSRIIQPFNYGISGRIEIILR